LTGPQGQELRASQARGGGAQGAGQRVLQRERQDRVVAGALDLGHEAVHDAAGGTTGERAREPRAVLSRAQDRPLVRLWNTGLVAGEEGRAQLHPSGPEGQSGRNAAAVHDAAGRHDGDLNRVGDGRHEGVDADQAALEVAPERRTVAAGLAALRHDRVDTRPLQRHRLAHRGRRAHQEHAARLHGGESRRRNNAERETESGGARLEGGGELVVERVGGRRGHLRRRQAQLGAVRRNELESACAVGGCHDRRLRSEEVDAERPVSARADPARGLGDLARSQVGTTDEAERTGVADRRHQRWRVTATGQRRLDDRLSQLEPARERRLDRHGPPPGEHRACRSRRLPIWRDTSYRAA
jgi:hypothetical protein